MSTGKVNCHLCKKETDKSEVVVIGDNDPGVRYKCSGGCRISNTKGTREKIIKKIAEAEEYSHLSMEEQVLERWGINFSDMEISATQYRDACTTYIHRNTGGIYKWSRSNHYWTKRD